MLDIKYGLRARVFADRPKNLETLTVSELILWRSANEEQTHKAIKLLRGKLPGTKIVLVVQHEFKGKFKVDEEITCLVIGGFKIEVEGEDVFTIIRQRRFALAIVIYNNLARKGYLEVEECALSCGSPQVLGIFPDGSVIEIEKNIERKRELAGKLNKRLWEKIKNA